MGRNSSVIRGHKIPLFVRNDKVPSEGGVLVQNDKETSLRSGQGWRKMIQENLYAMPLHYSYSSILFLNVISTAHSLVISTAGRNLSRRGRNRSVIRGHKIPLFVRNDKVLSEGGDYVWNDKVPSEGGDYIRNDKVPSESEDCVRNDKVPSEGRGYVRNDFLDSPKNMVSFWQVNSSAKNLSLERNSPFVSCLLFPFSALFTEIIHR